MNNLKSIQYNIEWCDGKYFPSTDVIDKTKNKISNSIENEFSSKIDNIKTPTDLIAFIAIFKWDLKDKLDYKYYVHFTKQLITYINGIIIEDKMQGSISAHHNENGGATLRICIPKGERIWRF